MSDLSRLPYSFPNSTGSVVWGKVDDAQLDDIINDSASPPVYRTQAAAEKRRRTVGMSGALKEAIMSGGQALQSATTRDKLAEGANYIAQPMLERAGNDIRGLKEALGPAPEGEQVPTASPPGMAQYGGGNPDQSQLLGMPGRVYDMARGFLSRGADVIGRSMLGQGDGARQLGASMMGNQDGGARLPRGDVQDPLAGTVMRAPPPMSGEFPVERPDVAALAGSVPPALLAQSAARAQPLGPVDDIQAGANAAKAIATPPAPAPVAAPGGPDEFSNMSPSFLEMAKKFVGAQEDAPLTAEDKWLALARAGFGMAASQAPSFGQALGEGAMSGITQLQQVRAQRAEQAARRAQMGLQVAGTDAQLRQGDRNYQLAQRREAREKEEFAAGAPEREARVNNLKASAAESYAQAEAAKKGGGTQVTARLSEALAIQQAYANRNPPVQIDIAEALEKTRAERDDGLTESQALRLAADAAEIAQVEGKSIEDVLTDLKKNADSLRGKSAPSGGTTAPAAPAGGGGAKTPPAAAIEALKANPQYRKQFDEKYGPGSAAKVLGG